MNEFSKHDVKVLIATRLGVHIDTILEPVPVVKVSDDLNKFNADGVPADTVYFGDLIIEGFDASAVKIHTEIDGTRSCKIDFDNGISLPVGNNINCLMFDAVIEYGGASAHFIGWEVKYTS